jgi:predicted lipoprotein with Yx(FWY)xxD motif
VGVQCFVGQESDKIKVQFFVGSSVVKIPACAYLQNVVCHFTETTILETVNGVIKGEAENHNIERVGKKINFETMKNLILTLTFIFVSILGFSQNTTYKTDAWGNTIAVDDRGNTIATQKTDAWGNKIWVDTRGNTITTQKKDAWGNTIQQDNRGNTQSTQKKDAWGNTIQQDSRGNTEYTYKKDAWGNTAVYDARGNKVGTYKKDAWGNTVFVRE